MACCHRRLLIPVIPTLFVVPNCLQVLRQFMCESGLDARPRPHVDPEQTEEREACTQLQLALIIN